MEGVAEMTIDEDVKVLTEGQSAYVPLIANTALKTLEKFRWYSLKYRSALMSEDDIERYNDEYGRK